MRDYLLLYINGKEHRLQGAEVFSPLSTWLRYEQQAIGTKVVCEEGDCGACTVLIGKVNNGEIAYRPLNSCIQYLYQLDCAHVVTIEGLRIDGNLNPVQLSMVEHHGAQCGYCTPGFIVAMCALFDCQKTATEQEIKDALTGNLCRCTGYEPIIKAGQNVAVDRVIKLNDIYPPAEMLKAFRTHEQNPVQIRADGKICAVPVDVKGAVEFKASHPGTVIVSGGTDVCVNCNKKGFDPDIVMSLSNVVGLENLKIANDVLIVGGKVTLLALEEYTRDLVPQLYEMMWLFGSPQIRNAGTLAGNIANASPIADTLPFLFVMEAQVELTGSQGARRVNINNFYKGYKQTDLAQDELITGIFIPIPQPDESLRLFKVSKRKNLDISTFTAAVRIKKSPGGKIDSARLAYGGVAPVVLRLPRTEAFLLGKDFNLEVFQEAGRLAREEITPISDVRGSADFRFQLAENIMSKFFYEVSSERELACR